MNKGLVVGILILLGLTLVGGVLWARRRVSVGGGSSMPTVEPTEVMMPKEETAGAGREDDVVAGGTREFVVVGSNFKFDVKEMRVKKGDTVRVIFRSAGGTHDWVVDEFDVRTSQLGEEEEEEIEFVADKAGTFEYYCSVGNHRAMGMVGKLVVE